MVSALGLAVAMGQKTCIDSTCISEESTLLQLQNGVYDHGRTSNVPGGDGFGLLSPKDRYYRENQCSPEVLQKCQGNVPCIDLRQGENHHHLMWLNADGTAHVDAEAGGIGAGDSRTWTCHRTGNGVGLVDVWNCPGFYAGGALTITEDYADDFTAAIADDHIDVCALESEPAEDEGQLAVGGGPSQCSPEALQKCQGNIPCIDLRQGENHHHLMWLNADGTAHVDAEAGGIGAGDSRTWTCHRTGNGVGLVDVWNCPGFYASGALTITEDYANDFTAAIADDHIDVCALESEPAEDEGCSQEALQKCQGNIPCIDLRQGENHHHLMWLNADGTAHVDAEASGIGAGDSRTWTCHRTGNGVSLVDVWHCPGFYSGGALTITANYADDFTAAIADDHIDVCAIE